MESKSQSRSLASRAADSPYLALLIVAAVGAALVAGLEMRTSSIESSLPFLVVVVVAPLIVSVSCFVVWRMYGGSRIFGRSYLFLGLGFLCNSVVEVLYVYFLDLNGKEVPPFTDLLLVAFYLFLVWHLVINIRYFSEHLTLRQKMMPVLATLMTVVGYLWILGMADGVEFGYDVVNVALSGLTAGLAAVGFTIFKRTALMTAWLFLLMGIIIGTAGDIMYNYFDALGGEFLENHSLALWITSNMIIIYAMYRHLRSM